MWRHSGPGGPHEGGVQVKKFKRRKRGAPQVNTKDEVGIVTVKVNLRHPGGNVCVRGNINRSLSVQGKVGDVFRAIERVLFDE